MAGVTFHHPREDEPLYEQALDRCPDVREYRDDPSDDGKYQFFLAVDKAGKVIGHCVIDVGEMGFGPLAKQTMGYIEDIEVDEPYRRRGIGSALLSAALDYAWRQGALHVRWTVRYDNTEGLGLYQKLGALFIPEEDPQARKKADYYTTVMPRPTDRA